VVAKPAIKKAELNLHGFNKKLALPYNLRLDDFRIAMQDIYDFFFDTNRSLIERQLSRLDDFVRPAILSGFLSDMITDSLGSHSRSLVRNNYHNGHPDLIVKGVYKNNATPRGDQGVEIKTTKHRGAAVDFHGGRDQTLVVFVYSSDTQTEPAVSREPLTFTGIYLAEVVEKDFNRYERGELGTRTSSLNKEARSRLRENWIYKA
jgi:hypothetical protein